MYLVLVVVNVSGVSFVLKFASLDLMLIGDCRSPMTKLSDQLSSPYSPE